MSGGFWRTTSRILFASFWSSGTSSMSTVDSIEPSGWICVTRVLPCAIDATWSWFTG